MTWQYCSDGIVDGVSGDVDKNYRYSTLSDEKVFVGKNGLVTWTEVEGAESYIVTKIVDGKKYYGSRVTTNSYRLKNIPNEDYKLYVIACTADGKSKAGKQISVKVNTVGTAADVKIDGEGTVTWTAAENADHYRVFKVIDGTKYYSEAVNGTTYKLKNFPRKDYEVYVASYGKNGNYTKSNVVKVDLPLGYVDEPVVTGSTITWEAVQGAVAYKVGKVVDGKTYYSSKTTNRTYTFKNVPKSDYKVFVVAFDKDGKKTWGKKVTVKGN